MGSTKLLYIIQRMNLILKRSGRHQWKKPLTSGKESILQQDFNFFIIGSGGADR
jgi:hypothetical protein